MADGKVTVFPVDNGDTFLIEHDDCVVVTDINYRKKSQDDQEEEYYDVGEDIRDACYTAHQEYKCDVFVLTHPDEDHRRGFEDLFFVGKPSEWDSDSSEVLINELWVSDYMTDKSRSTDSSKFLFDEVDRRKKLDGTNEGEKDGNRIKVLSSDGDETTGDTGKKSLLNWKLLAPTVDEADIDAEESSNDSSLVIRWNAKVSGADNLILLGGDSGVAIWERIWKDHQNSRDDIKWQFLVAPHHCSRSSMARKNDEDEYEYSDDALSALGEMDGDGFIASSSKEIKDDDDNPPSYDAKGKYLDILHKSKKDGEKRFYCTATHKNGKSAPVVFKFTGKGISTKSVATASIVSPAISSEASTYG